MNIVPLVLGVTGVTFAALGLWLVARVINGGTMRSRTLGVALQAIGVAVAIAGLCYFGAFVDEWSTGHPLNGFDDYRSCAAIGAIVIGVISAGFGVWLRRP